MAGSDMRTFAEIFNNSFDPSDRETIRQDSIQSTKTADGSMLYGKPNWQDQQPRSTELVFPDLTPHWYDIQIAVQGVGDWEYADFIKHHVNALTEYLISEGHGD
eukprot:4446335-Heterocapsa_arctica.AAC.1